MTRWHRVAVVVLGIWAILLIAPEFVRVFGTYGTLGFSADNNGVVADVADVPAGKAGLREGDRLDLRSMRCNQPSQTACKNLLAVVGGLGGLQYVSLHRPVTLKILRGTGKGEVARTITIDPVPAPMPVGGRLVLFLDQVAGIVMILLALSLVWQSPNLMTWGFFLYAMWFNPGQYFVTYAFLQNHPDGYLAQEAAQAIAMAAGYAGFAYFVLRFPNDKTEPRWRPFERWLPVVGIVLALLELGSFATAFGYPTQSIAQASYFAPFVVYVFIIYALIRRTFSLPRVERQRMFWVLAGCAIGLLAYIVADAIETGLFGGVELSETWLDLLYLGNGVLGYAVFRAVREHRIVNVFVPMWHTAVAVALSLAALALIETIHHYIEEDVKGQMETVIGQYGEWLWTAIAVFLTIVAGKIYETIIHVMNHRLRPAFHHAKNHLKQIGAKLTKEEHKTEEIEQALVHEASRSLRLASAAVFRKENSTFRLQNAAVGWDDAIAELSVDHPLVVESLASEKAIRVREDHGQTLESLPHGIARPVAAVAVQNPLHVYAIAFYGPHHAGDDLDVEERKVLDDLASAASVAYERLEWTQLTRELEELKQQLARKQ